MAKNDSCILEFLDVKMSLGKQNVLGGVSGKVHKGRTIGIWGGNGSGKTTLLRILAGWDEADSGTITIFDKSHKVILVPANALEFLLGWYRVERNLEVFEGLAIDRGHCRDKLKSMKARLTEKLGLDRYLKDFPCQLSSGEQARVALVCSLLFCPNILMLDEIFAHIDWRTQSVVADCLRDELASETDMSLIVVSHLLGPILLLAQDIWQFERSKAISIKCGETFFGEIVASVEEQLVQEI